MKNWLVIIALGVALTGCSQSSPNKKQESSWLGWNQKNKGYTEEKLSDNRWLIKYHVPVNSKDGAALKLLYGRADEFGKQVCSNGFETQNQTIQEDYMPVTGVKIGRVASVTLVCK